MTDDEMVRGFEDGSLPPRTFDHRAHVRLAWIYLTRHGRAETEARLLAGLRALAARAGTPEKFDRALTLAWIAATDSRRAPDDGGFERFAARHPELFDRSWAPAAAAVLAR